MSTLSKLRKWVDETSITHRVIFVSCVMIIFAGGIWGGNEINTRTGMFDNVLGSDDVPILNVRYSLLMKWRLSHFILYFIIGIVLPEWWKEAVLVGVSWELLEFSLNKLTGTVWWGTPGENVADIFANMLGFCTGAYIGSRIE